MFLVCVYLRRFFSTYLLCHSLTFNVVHGPFAMSYCPTWPGTLLSIILSTRRRPRVSHVLAILGRLVSSPLEGPLSILTMFRAPSSYRKEESQAVFSSVAIMRGICISCCAMSQDATLFLRVSSAEGLEISCYTSCFNLGRLLIN